MNPKKFSKEIDNIIESTVKKEIMNLEGGSKKQPKTIKLNEAELYNIVQKVIKEGEKEHPAMKFVKNHKTESGKINTKNKKDVDAKLKKRENFEGNDVGGMDKKEFPKQIGQNKKNELNKKRENTKEEEEFIEDFRGGGMEDLSYAGEPSKEFMERAENSIKGSSKTGNPVGKDVANAVETDLGEKIVKKIKRKQEKVEKAPMYKKEEQPTGKQEKDEEKESTSINESVQNDMDKIKKLYNYSDKNR